MSSPISDGARLRRLLALGYVFHEAVALRLGINATDLKCVELAAGEKSLTPTRLAELAGVTSGAITGVLDRLEQAGIVTREPDPSDRRSVVVRVADERLREIGVLYDPVLADALPADAKARAAAERQVEALTDALERATARLRAETRGGMVDDRTFIAPLAGATHGRLIFISGAPRLSMTAAPFGAGAVARVVMETSASRLSLSAGSLSSVSGVPGDSAANDITCTSNPTSSRVPSGNCSSCEAATSAVSRITSCPHCRQNVRPTRANSSRM